MRRAIIVGISKISKDVNSISFDNDYLRRLSHGDPLVEAHFAKYFGELLYVKLRLRIHSSALIEDIRQETLLRVWKAARQNAIHHPGHLGAYVNGVCHHVLQEHCRADRAHESTDDPEYEPFDLSIDLDSSLVHAQRKQTIEQIMGDLPERDRRLLRDVFLNERDKAEICKEFAVDADYLRVLVHRAKVRFKQLYQRRAVAPGHF